MFPDRISAGRLLAGHLTQLHQKRQRPLTLDGRTAVILNDGIATGATMRVATAACRQGGAAEVAVAVPVASRQALVELRPIADAIICLDTPADLLGVEAHHRNLGQVSGEEVCKHLAARPLAVEQGAQP